MEHFLNFFCAQAPNSAGASAFCNLTSNERSLERARGPFLESPGNFTGPKSNIQIEI